MAVTLSFPVVRASGPPQIINFGDMFGIIADVTFDSAYPSGGYAIAGNKLKFPGRRVLGAQHLGWGASSPLAGIGRIGWDAVNSKLQVFTDGSEPFIKCETVTVTSNAGRLSRVPGYIIGARASTGGTTGVLRIIPTGETVGTGQVAVNFTTGAIATFATDAVTAAVFCYIPMGVGPFIESNRVIDEARTAAANTFNFANRAGLIQYVWNDTGNNLPTLVPVGEAPGSGAIAIDINNSGNTTVTTNAAQGTNNFKVTYWKFTAVSPQEFSWTDQGDITVTSTSLFAFADDLPVPPNGLWVPGFGNVLVGETGGGNNLQAILTDAAGSAGANVAVYDPTLGKIVLSAGDSYATVEMPYVILNAANAPALGGQVATGFNLTSMVARMLFFGK